MYIDEMKYDDSSQLARGLKRVGLDREITTRKLKKWGMRKTKIYSTQDIVQELFKKTKR